MTCYTAEVDNCRMPNPRDGKSYQLQMPGSLCKCPFPDDSKKKTNDHVSTHRHDHTHTPMVGTARTRTARRRGPQEKCINTEWAYVTGGHLLASRGGAWGARIAGGRYSAVTVKSRAEIIPVPSHILRRANVASQGRRPSKTALPHMGRSDITSDLRGPWAVA